MDAVQGWVQAKVVPSNGQQQRRHHGVLDEAARELVLERDLLPVDTRRHNYPAVLRVDLPDLLPLDGLGVSQPQDPMLSLLICPPRQHASQLRPPHSQTRIHLHHYLLPLSPPPPLSTLLQPLNEREPGCGLAHETRRRR